MAKYEEQLRNARERNDTEDSELLEEFIKLLQDRMTLRTHAQIETDALLTKEEQRELRDIDTELEYARNQNDEAWINRLLKRRYTLLRKPVESNLAGPDRRRGVPVHPDAVSFLRVIRSGLSLVAVAPEWARRQICCPVGLLWGENDQFFPAEKARASMDRWSRKRRRIAGRKIPWYEEHVAFVGDKLSKRIRQYYENEYPLLFPHAPAVFDADIIGWPHFSFSDQPRFAEYIVQMASLLREAQERSSDQCRRIVRFGQYPP